MKVEMNTELNSNIDNIIAQLEVIENLEVSAGWYNGKKHINKDTGSADINIAQIAYWLNYGNKFIPERPFMDLAYVAFRRRALRDLTKILNRALAGKRSDRFQVEMGKAFEETIRRLMDNPPSTFPILSQTTLDWKAPETRMFYDTGQLMSNLTYKVKRKKRRESKL